MSFDCYCDYDPPEVYSSRTVRGRKEYTCYECHRKIAIGEKHEYVFGVYEGYPYTPRTCSHCVEIREFVSGNIPCFCWCHGNVLSDARDAIDAAYSRAAEEVTGLFFGFGRLLVKAKRAKASVNRSSSSLPTPAATPTDSANPPPVESVGPNSTNGWQLIDTAPTDGTFVFLYWPTMSITSFPQVGFHHGDEYGWELVNDRDYGEVFPTHWRELFSPPNSKASVGPNSEAQS